MQASLRNGGIVLLLACVLGARLYGVQRRERAAESVTPALPAAVAQPQAQLPVAQTGTAVPAARRSLPPPTSPATLDESALMTELRRAQDSDPELALALARDGNQRFPDSADAPERAASIVHSLTALGRASEGRAQAEDMVNRYPDSLWVRGVEQFTGAHRHRNVRSNAEGQLEYY